MDKMTSETTDPVGGDCTCNPAEECTCGAKKQVEDREILEEMSTRLDIVNGYWSTQYDQIKEDLEFLSGDQWDDYTAKKRKKRPMMVSNFSRTYVNRIINPIRMAPYAIELGGEDNEQTEIVQSAIRDIELRSDAASAYEMATELACAAGIGWIHVKSEYEDDESLEQRITIERITEPRSIYLDPSSKATDGSDARYAFVMTWMPTKDAEDGHGDEVSADIAGLDVYGDWQIPEDCTPYVIYYRKFETKEQKYWFADGSSAFEIPEGQQVVGSRMIERKKIECITVCGSKVVDRTIIPIPYIPVVPVYGDHLYLPDERLYFAGVIRQVADNQRMVNYYLSLEAELVSTTPKSQWVAALGQLEGLEKVWNSENQPDTLVYNPVATQTGQAVAPPQRVDNRAQTDWVLAGRQANTGEMGRAAGIFDPMLGSDASAGAAQAISGRAVMLRQTQGEIATAQYTDNLLKSVKQVGKIILAMIPVYYDTMRPVPVRDEEGQLSYQPINLGQVVGNWARYDVRVSAGPLMESRKQQALLGLQQMAQVMPDKAALMADKIFESIDTPGAKILAERFRKMLPPELQDNKNVEAPDPQVIQIMETAKQTIMELQKTADRQQGYITQLQQMIINDQKDREAKITEALIKSETTLAQERIKQEGANLREAASIEANTNQSIMTVASNFIASDSQMPSMVSGSGQIAPMAPGPVYQPDASFIDAVSGLQAGMQNPTEGQSAPVQA